MGDNDNRTELLESQQSLCRVQLSVHPPPAADCAVVDTETDPTAIRQSLRWADSDQRSLECHAVLGYEDRPQQYRTRTDCGACLCPVFERHDCLTEFTGAADGSLTVVVSMPSRDRLRDLVADLRGVGATVDIEWIVQDDTASGTTEIDVSSITSKQREALETALELGYYDSPRTADLGDCAQALGISKSAVSQRLNAAETKLVRSFLDTTTRTEN
jgi:hypothetical protein